MFARALLRPSIVCVCGCVCARACVRARVRARHAAQVGRAAVEEAARNDLDDGLRGEAAGENLHMYICICKDKI